MIERHSYADRASWLAFRGQDLTASVVPAVMGVGYQSPLQVYMEKTGRAPPVEETNIMQRGRWLEFAAIAALRERCPHWRILHPLNIYLRDSDCRLGATPDAIAEDPEEPGLINCQVKTVTRPAFERDWGEDNAPVGHKLQTLAEGFLLDARTSYLVALVIDTYSADLALIEVPRHPQVEARICQEARQFWQNIADGVVPKPDYERDAELVRLLNPPDAAKPAPLDLTGDNLLPGLLTRRARHKRFQKLAEADCRRIDAEVVDKLDGATAAVLPGWKISHTMTHRDAYTVEAKDYPSLRVTPTKDQAA